MFLLVSTALFMTLSAAPITAHEGREVGDYVLEFGWQVEPAYSTLLNGVDLTISHHETEEPIEGAEQTLTLEVQFGPAGKTIQLRPVSGEPGHYTAPIIPMQPGDYTFQLNGTIDDTAVDETFAATDEQFSTVEPVTDIQFP